MKNRKGLKAVIAAIVALAVLAGGFAVLYFKVISPQKEITLKVIQLDESEQIFVIKTKAEDLGTALMNEKLIDAYEGEYGLYITAVTGVAADEALEQWWCLTKGGESVETGISSVKIANNDVYELTLKQGW